MIGPTNRKNLLTLGGDPVTGTDSGSLLVFSTSLTVAEWGFLGDLLVFLIQLSAAFHDILQNDGRRQGN